MKKITIFFIVLLTIAIKNSAQNQATSFTLDESLYGYQDYEATEFINLKPGFDFIPQGSGQFFHGKINELLVCPPTINEFGGPNINDNYLAGNMTGSYEISPTGAILYQLPIDLPVGVNNLKPNLSFSYNSQSDEGLMNMAWNITGLSAISRTGKNIFNDGSYRRIMFDDEDNFSLDGNRLIPLVGLNGMNGTEYRTELDNYSKIISYRDGTNGPTYFKVWTKSGQILEYGNLTSSSGSRIELSGTTDRPYIWLLSKVSDRFGNEMIYDYIEDNINGEFRINSITYGGGKCRVSFEYENKTAQTKYIYPGKQVKLSKRLKNVNIYVDNTLQYYYDIVYLKGMVKSINYLNANNIGLNDVSFNYNTTNANHTQEFTGIEYKYVYDNVNFYFDSKKSIFADFNGDGITDALIVYSFGDNKTNGYRLYINKSGNFSLESYADLPNEDFVKFHPCDLNGDGKTDLLMEEKGNSVTHITPYISLGNAFSKENNFDVNCEPDHIKMLPADYNKDGKTELSVILQPINWINHLTIKTYSFASDPFQTVSLPDDEITSAQLEDVFELRDMDADGVPEIIRNALQDDGLSVYKYIFEENNMVLNTYNDLYGVTSTHVKWCDINGDGYSDYLYFNQQYQNYGIRIFDGEKFIPYAETYALNIINNHPAKLISSVTPKDYNGDGYDDLCMTWIADTTIDGETKKLAHVLIFYNNTYEYITKYADFDLGHLIGDFNGDGNNDLLFETTHYQNTTGSIMLYGIKLFSESKPRVLANCIDGYGNVTNFTSKHLTLTNQYTKYGDAKYPFCDFIGPLIVTTAVEVSDGLGQNRVQKYYYEGAKTHLLGKGFLGFMKRSVLDDDTKNLNEIFCTIESSNDYIYMHPYLTIDYVFQNNVNKKIKETNDKYFIYTDDLRFHYSPYLIQSHTKLWDINGEFIGTTRKKLSYDESGLKYGNITSTSILSDETEISENSTDDEFRYSKKIVMTYDYNIGKWILNRPAIVTVKHNEKNKAEITETTSTSYYPETDYRFPLANIEKINPDNELELKITYDYNTHGLVISKITSTPNYDPLPPLQKLIDRTENYGYDPSFRFLTSTTNSKGYTKTNVIEPKSGVILKSIDANGLETIYQYDQLNRLTKTILPNKNESVKVLRWSKDILEAPDNSLTYTWECSSGELPIMTFYDKLGRKIRTVSTNNNNEKIFIDFSYDHFGHQYMTSEPHLPDESNYGNTIISYDRLDRVEKIIFPDDTQNNFIYSARKTTKKDAANHEYFEEVDATNNVIIKRDPNNTSINYVYNSDHSLYSTKIGDLESTLSYNLYDINGNKISTIDPSRKNTTYKYNPYNEIASITDAENVTFCYHYDNIGRLTNKINSNDNTDYTAYTFYETQGLRGMIKSKYNKYSSTSYFYDNIYNLVQRNEFINATSETYSFSYEYDNFNRQKSVTYPNSLKINYIYENSNLKKILNSTTNMTIWEAISYNKYNQPLQTLRDNNLKLIKEYFPITNRLKRIQVDGIQDLEYKYDLLGNITDRYDNFHLLNGISQHENFIYDNASQLKIVNGIKQSNYDYSTVGSITSNSETGVYNYVSNPYQIDNVTSNANTLPSYLSTLTTTYGSDQKIINLENEQYKLDIQYGPSGERLVQRLYTKTGNLLKEKLFIGGLVEIERNKLTNYSKNINYIQSPDGLIAVEISNSQNEDGWYWVFTDHLSSILTMIKREDQTKYDVNYDCWGNKRSASNWQSAYIGNFPIDRGFTNHEHLKEFSLINMNGRIYDPVLATFLSPDNVTQDESNPLSYNGYIYCLNNPLKYNDPTGHFWQTIVYNTFMYTKSAYDNRNQTTGQWDWGLSNKTFIFGASTSTNFTGTTVFAGIEWNNGISSYTSYSSNNGLGYGSSLSSQYYPEAVSPETTAINSMNNFSRSQANLRQFKTYFENEMLHQYTLRAFGRINHITSVGIIRENSMVTHNGGIKFIYNRVGFDYSTDIGVENSNISIPYANIIASVSGVVGIASDIAQETAKIPSVGYNYIAYNKCLLNSVKYLKPLGYLALGVSTYTDVELSRTGQQSWYETGGNATVSVAAAVAGGTIGFGAGVLIQLDYVGAKFIITNMTEHPEYFNFTYTHGR